MAANMGQMAPNGQQMLVPRQLQQVVYQNLMSSNQPGGWQATVPIQDRLGKAMNLITNCVLAAPGQEWQNAVRWGIEVERKAYLTSPDRQTYEQHIAVQASEMAKKRQANASDLQNQLSSDAARQTQLQAQQQQQQMILNQMKGMGQAVPQGLQHLQHQMQPSPIPQQQTQQQQQQAQQQQQQSQQMGLGMGNPAMLQNRIAQTVGYPMGQQQRQPPTAFPHDMNQLNPSERRSLQEVAQKLLNAAPEHQKSQQRAELMQKMNPQVLQEMQNSGRDPLLYFYQQRAFQNMHKQAQIRILQQRNQGMQPNMDQAQAQAQAQAMLLQQRQMNQGMMGQLGQQQSMQDNQVFANMESIRNDQKAGLLAQQAGQVVVPANPGAGRNNAQQSMGGLGLQNMSNGQQGPGQQQRGPMSAQQQQQQLNLQQQLAAQQARLQGAGRGMGQQNGLPGGPGTTSQSPGMSTLTAPMQQPPVPMNHMNGAQMNVGNPGMGQGLDQRFNQGNARPQGAQPTHLNNPIVRAMLSSLNPEQRQNVSNLPPEKLRELVAKWTEQQRMMSSMAQGAKPQQMAGMPGQPQASQMGGMNQFNPGNVPQQPQPGNGAMSAGMPGQGLNAGLNPNPAARNMHIMDSMDIPPQVLAQLSQIPLNLTPDIRKWAQLKAWMAQNQVSQNLRNQLNNFQAQQFRSLLEKRNAMANTVGQAGRPMPPGQGPNGLAQPGMNQTMAQPQTIPYPPQIRHVTPQELENYRKTHPAAASVSNEMLYNMLVKMKAEAFAKKYMENQAMNRSGLMGPKPSGAAPQPPVSQPGVSAGPAQPGNLQNTPQKLPQSIPETGMASKNGRQPQQTPRPSQANPSPATVQKSLKRPNPDDSAEQATQANPAAQPAQPAQRPGPQAEARPMPQPTPEQMARMTPEQRARFEQLTRNRQMGLTAEDMNRLKVISAEEQRSLAQDPMTDIPMSAEERAETIAKIQETVKNMSKIGRGLGKWYAITHDDSRARMFFKTRMRLIRQFADGDKMTTLRDSFSIRSSELDTARNMMESMAKDLAAHFDIPKKPNQEANGAQVPQQQPTPRAQPAPLNAANLEKQTQALTKMQQHQRSGSKSGPAPPAPTSTQPPVSFGGQQLPVGQPTYLGKPSVTADNLHLPPPKKRKQTLPVTTTTTTQQQQQQTSSPALSGAAPSPQLKAPSPEIKRQAPPEIKAPKFVCPEVDCEMHSAGFATEEARNAHHVEEHVRPMEDPFRFVQENLALTLGLDAQGNPKMPLKSLDGSQPAGLPMSASASKQGQTPGTKLDLASTPMSRDASMRRQGSLTGGKGAENTPTPGRVSSVKNEDTPRLGDVKTFSGKQEPDLITIPIEDPWANSTIDPQSLLASFAPLEPMAGGLISDLSAYRSLTPNDTPESSKDSGTSEPNSDISEAAHIDIDLNWQSIDADLLVDMTSINMDGFDAFETDPTMSDSFQLPAWDDSEFSKSYQLDGSLFSMDMA